MPFENLDKAKIKKLNLILLILFTFIALVVNIFFPFPGLLGFAFLAVPATLLVIGGRVRDGVICAIAGCLPLFLVDYLLAPVAMLMIITIAFTYKEAVRKEKSLKWVIGSNFGIFCSAVILYIILVSLINRVNYFSGAMASYNSYIDLLASDPLMSNYSSLMLGDDAQFATLLQQSQDMLRFMPYIIPGLLIVFFTLASLINYWGSFVYLKKYGIELKAPVPFKEWDLPWTFVWGIIVGIVVVLIPWGSNAFGGAIKITGYNLIVVFGVLYFVLGISVLWGIFDRFKVSSMWRIAFLIMLGFFLVLAVFLMPLMGLIDIWANFRKLKRA